MKSIMDEIEHAEVPSESDDQAIARLAALPDLEYAKQRKSEAKKLEIGVVLLDKLVKAERKTDEWEDGGKAGELVNIAKASSVFFCDAEGEGYATFKKDDHEETWPLKSEGFIDWLSYRSYQETKTAPSESVVSAAPSTLRGIAKYEGKALDVFRRCAPYRGGYLIDLTNEEWQVVEVSATGWKVLNSSPLKFVRSSTADVLPLPTTGNLDLLWRYVNVEERDRTLILAFVLESWRPDAPYPLLFITGEQGCGKSCTHKYIRQVSDPNTIPLRTAPKSVEDVFVSAGANHQASFENMSHLSAPMQDALCTLATGGGFAKRKLYSDADESVINIKRPVIINGISDSITRPDLIDRTLRITTPLLKIMGEEATLETDFNKSRGAIFGGLLDLFRDSLRELPSIEITTKLRMIGFIKLGEAIHRVLNIESPFIDLYQSNRAESLARSIEASPAMAALCSFIATCPNKKWEGTVKQLKIRLERHEPGHGEGWPKSPKGLADALRRMAPALRSDGIEVAFRARQRDGYHVSVFAKDTIIQNNVHHVHTFTEQAGTEKKTTTSTLEREHVNLVNVKSEDYIHDKKESVTDQGLAL